MARDNAVPSQAHTEERKLITYLGDNYRPVDKRKRGTIIDGLLGYTDDGQIVHIPTGLNISPPKVDGVVRVDCKDSRKFVLWMLDQDPEGWESSRNYKIGEPLTPALQQRLLQSRNSYPGD